MRSWFDGPIRTELSADMRYGEQVYEIGVPFDDVNLDSPDFATQLKSAFEKRHETLYTYCLPDQEPVLVNARVATIGVHPPGAEPQSSTSTTGLTSEREIYLERWLTVPVYGFRSVAVGTEIVGPAMVESETTTVLLRDGDVATITAQGWLDISVPELPSSVA